MKLRQESGFTLLELVMVIVIIGILGSVAVRSADFALDRNRYHATVEEMRLLGHAIAGNPDLVSAGVRTEFGYVGDMGSLPGTLDALVTDPGGRWRGPYVVNPVQEDPDGFKTDGWGHEYTYPVGASRVKISSSGGGQPITHQFAPSEGSLTSNTISGTITDWNGSNPTVADLPNITVTVHHPSGGSMTATSTAPQAGGVFAVGGIPIGIHRVVATHAVLADSAVKLVTVTPGSSPNVVLRLNATLPGTEAGGGAGGASGSLEYVAGSATVFGGGNRHVRFQVRNAGDQPAGIASLTAVYTPVAYYSQVRWASSTVWSSSPRHGSGEETVFTQQKTVSPGSTAAVELRTFRTTPSGGGGYANMSNVSFQITLSDGSVIVFTTP